MGKNGNRNATASNTAPADTVAPRKGKLLGLQADLVTRHPFVAVLLILLITGAAIGVIGIKGIDSSFSEKTWQPDLEIANMNTEVEERFTDTYPVMVLVKPLDGSSVMSPGAFVEMLDIESRVVNDTEIIPYLHDGLNPDANVMSPPSLIGNFLLSSMYMSMGIPPRNITISHEEIVSLFAGMDQAAFERNMSMIFNDPAVPGSITMGLSFMMSRDFKPETGNYSARACLMIYEFSTLLRDLPGDTGLEIEQHIVDISGTGEYEHIHASAISSRVMSSQMNNAMNSSNMVVLPIAFVVVLLILAITYRDLIDILISTSALVMSIIWMYGFGSFFDFSFNPMTSAVPVLLIGLGIDYGIHVTLRYREEVMGGRRIGPATRYTILSVGAALSLATLTTLVSFLSNLSSPMVTFREFGLLASVGIIASFMTMTIFVPGLKKIKDDLFEKKGWKYWMGQDRDAVPAAREGVDRERDDVSGAMRISRAMERGINTGVRSGAWAARKIPVVVIVASLLLTGVAGYGWSRVETTFDIRDFLPPDLQSSQDLVYMMDHFVAQESFTVIYFKGNISQPEVFVDIDAATVLIQDTDSVVKQGNVSKVFSVNTMLTDLATYTGGQGTYDFNFDPGFAQMYYYRYFNSTTGLPLPGTTSDNITTVLDYVYENHRELASAYLYRDGSGAFSASLIKISVSVDYNDEMKLQSLLDQLTEDSQPLRDDPHIDHVIVTGGPVVSHVVLKAINETQIRSIIITMVTSIFMLMIVFVFETKRLGLGIPAWLGVGSLIGVLTMIPVMLCMVWIMGTMYLMDYNLDVMTISITSLTIGLGITYGIHYTHRFLEDLEWHSDISKALDSTSSHTGVALLGAAATTIAGFGMLKFSLLPPLQKFGVLTALTILYSFLATVLILPTLLALWAKLVNRIK